jgi:hypothetical protein
VSPLDREFGGCDHPGVPTWSEFDAAAPSLAEAGRDLLYQFGVGLGFLATVRADGGPRVHPVGPLLGDGGLHVFVVPSPKQADLRHDGRFALHSFPCADGEDAFYVTGRATEVGDARLRAALASQFVEERREIGVPAPADDHALFALGVEHVLVTRTTGHGDHAPVHTRWP